MRSLVEHLMRIWPINRLMTLTWRHAPFPRGFRSRIMRTANDSFLVGVIVIIQDEHGQVFLVRNTYDPRNAWTLPGGWMGRYEQPEDCAQREILEETGFEIEVERLVAAFTRKRLPSVDLVYQARLASGTFRPSVEIQEARFFPTSELPDGLSLTHKHMIRDLAVRVEDERGPD